MGRKIITFIAFILVAVAAFFGIQFFTKTGMFKVYGVLNIADNVPEDVKKSLASITSDETRIEHNIDVKIEFGTEYPEYIDCSSQSGCKVSLLYDVLVPITDFYNPKNSIAYEDLSNMMQKISESYPGKASADESSEQYISVLDLSKDQKVLAVNNEDKNEYYLDTLNSGAIFVSISVPILGSNEQELDEDEKRVVSLIEPVLKDFPTKDSVLSFVQTGVTALSRNMLTKLNQTGGDASYFAANIKDFLSSKDLTHISNESSFTDYATSSNICADPRMIEAIKAIGTDIVELTGNHNLDCGDDAAIETIDQYNELGMKVVGGGKNADDAAKPLIINQKGTGITFLAYNQSTGGATYDNTPGANQYYEEDVVANIAAAKERGDTVIIDIQYYECSAYVSTTEDRTCDYANSAAGDQVGFFRHLIDLGADIVVGTSAHQPQTYEQYGGGAIYYGLGNLFFDQVWWPGTTRSLTLTHYFWNGKLLNTRIMPTVFDSNMQVELMDEENAEWFIERLNQVRP